MSLAEDTKVQAAALIPWKVTVVPVHEVPEPAKPAPFTVTTVPAGPEVGLKEEIVGAIQTLISAVCQRSRKGPSAQARCPNNHHGRRRRKPGRKM